MTAGLPSFLESLWKNPLLRSWRFCSGRTEVPFLTHLRNLPSGDLFQLLKTIPFHVAPSIFRPTVVCHALLSLPDSEEPFAYQRGKLFALKDPCDYPQVVFLLEGQLCHIVPHSHWAVLDESDDERDPASESQDPGLRCAILGAICRVLRTTGRE